jgi:hypothetical protein
MDKKARLIWGIIRDFQFAATTLSIMTFSKITLCITTFNIMTVSMTINKM